MSFLGDLFSNAWQGLTGGLGAAGRGVDDLVHGDTSSAANEGENSFRELGRIPGTTFSTLRGLYGGANGNLDWNPYSQNNSVWDQAAGGGASEDPKNRAVGRTIGTLAGSWGLSSVFGPTVAGAMTGAGKAAGEGGSGSDIVKGGMQGGGAGYLGGSVADANLAGSAGVTDPTAAGAINGALGGVTATAATPGSSGRDIAKGGIFGGLRGGLQSNGGGNMDYEEGGYSRAPWAQTRDDSVFSNEAGPMSLPTNAAPSSASVAAYSGQKSNENPFQSYIDKALGIFKQPDGSWDGKKIDGTLQGLMGLYGGYQRRRAANQFLRGMTGRRNDYETNMRNELMRKDAMSGRRSAYDTRAVELNSKLAALDAQQAPALMSAQNSSLAGLFDMLRSGYGMARDNGMFNTRYQTPDMSVKPLQLQQPFEMSNLDQAGPLSNPESPYTLAGAYNTMRRRNYTGGI